MESDCKKIIEKERKASEINKGDDSMRSISKTSTWSRQN